MAILGFHVERCSGCFSISVFLFLNGRYSLLDIFGGSRETPFELFFNFGVFVLHDAGFLLDFVWGFA